MRELCNHPLFLRCNPINSEMKMLSSVLFSRSPTAIPHAQSIHHNKRHNVILKFNHHIVCFLKTILLNPESEEFWTDSPSLFHWGVLPAADTGPSPLTAPPVRRCVKSWVSGFHKHSQDEGVGDWESWKCLEVSSVNDERRLVCRDPLMIRAVDVCCFYSRSSCTVLFLSAVALPGHGENAAIWALGDRVEMWKMGMKNQSEEGQTVLQRKLYRLSSHLQSTCWGLSPPVCAGIYWARSGHCRLMLRVRHSQPFCF